MTIPRRTALRTLAAVACAAAALSLSPLAQAQSYPSKTITIVVPFQAGGGVDTMARVLAEKLKTRLNQPVIVDNKPGASGMLGAQAVAKATPDGHTLLMGSAGETAINPYIYKERMLYDPARDFAPVALVARVPNVLVARADLPASNVAELLAHAKENPGKLTYATSGVGNPQHFNGELLAALAGLDLVHVPYRGAAGQLADVAGGNVDLSFVSYAGAASFLKSGRLKALAVTSEQRASFAPDIPTLAEEQALAGYNLSNWFGVFAPAGTPEQVQTQLNAAIVEALRDEELSKRLNEQGGEIAPMTQQEFADFIRTESAQYQRIVEQAKITAD